MVSDPTINTSDEERRALDEAAELLTRYLNPWKIAVSGRRCS
jgi:hypothetical protein